MDVRTTMKRLRRTDRATHDAIEQVTGGRGIARVRQGVLFSSGGVTIGAGGLPNITQIRLYATPLGTVEPGIGIALTPALTNLVSAHKVESSKAFVALSMGFRWFYLTRIVVGTAIQTIQDDYILDLADRTGWTLSLTGDEQRLGPSAMWPGPAAVMAGAIGNLAAGAQSASNRPVQIGGGRLDRQLALHEPYNIDSNSTLQVTGTVDPVPAAVAALSTAVICVQHACYGYEIQKVSG